MIGMGCLVSRSRRAVRTRVVHKKEGSNEVYMTKQYCPMSDEINPRKLLSRFSSETPLS
jgi:hypothetical protein